MEWIARRKTLKTFFVWISPKNLASDVFVSLHASDLKIYAKKYFESILKIYSAREANSVWSPLYRMPDIKKMLACLSILLKNFTIENCMRKLVFLSRHEDI